MKAKFQKILSLSFAFLMTSSLIGCGGKSSNTEQTNSSVNTNNTEAAGESDTEVSAVTPDVPLKEADSDDIKEIWKAEVYNYKLIRNIPTTYEENSYSTYCSNANILLKMDPNELEDIQQELISKIKTARENLIQVKPYSETTWFLWGEQMPMTESKDSLTFTLESYDNEDFAPFIVPYLLDDQSSVKGNMIVIAGGGYSSRGNEGEGYPVAKGFNDLGYNCYVLQRRVEPYSTEDVWLDMQRSVRLVRSKVDELSLGGADCICAAGFSGGSGTILGAIANYYGDIKPSTFDKTYKDDAIDEYSADLTVACTMYGPNYTFGENFEGLKTDNPNIPAIFIGGGADDNLTYEDDFKLAASVYGKVPVEIHTYANVGHGFGCGVNGTGSTLWMQQADLFITNVCGLGEKTEIVFEVPDTYTKVQTFKYAFGFGDTEVQVYTNDDQSMFYATFIAFDSKQVLEGFVNSDGNVTVTYDESGFMSGDAQAIWNSTDPSAWTDR